MSELIKGDYGYEVKSDNGIHYALYEGMTIGAEKQYTSDMIFIMLDDCGKYDERLDNHDLERVHFVGWAYGCFMLVDSDFRDEMKNILFSIVDDWEKKNPEIINAILGKDVKTIPDGIDLSMIKDVRPVYTGGNCWNLDGTLTDGTFFVASDMDYDVAIINTDPTPARHSKDGLYCGWEEEHLIRWMDEEEGYNFFLALIAWCKANLPADSTFLCDSDGADGMIYELRQIMFPM